MKFAVTVVSPPGYVHAAAFHDVAACLHEGLKTLGHEAIVTTEGALPGWHHIVLGANLLPFHPMPLAANAVVYNLEQVEPGSPWFQPALIEILRRHTVWDYSERNARVLKELGVPVSRVVPIGHAQALTRVQRVPEPDIDVLFFGAVNERRQRLLHALQSAGLKVVAVFGVYGPERDALVARAKLAVNIHYYEAKVLEVVRVAYLLANACPVLSEPGADPAEDACFAGAVEFAEPADFVARAQALVAAPARRQKMAIRGLELMRERPVSNYLAGAIEPTGTGAPP